MSDMYFDVSTFNFDDLTDVVTYDSADAIPAKAPRNKGLDPVRKLSNEIGADGGSVDDAGDLIEYSGMDFPEDEEDYNDNVDDLLTEQKAKSSLDARSMFSDIDDEHAINFGDGFELSKAQIKELFKAKGKVDHDSAFLSEQAQTLDAATRAINERAFMQNTVLEQNIITLTNRLNNPNLPDHEYAATAKQLQVAKATQQQLVNDINIAMQNQAEREQVINGYRIRSADQQMANTFPQWNNHKEDVLNYIVNDSGVPVTTLEKVYDKGFMQLALKAYLYDQSRKAVKEKFNNTAVNARSSVGAKSSTRNQKQTEVDKIQAQKAIAKLGSSSKANRDAFKYLIN
ncbi:hypothetical protein QUR06_000262 [Escherichia coli]|nr:hypothetical protein [Escherichia coli]